MTDADAGLGYELDEIVGKLADVLDLVVHEVDLSATAQFAQDGLADRGVIPLGDEGLDREPLGGRRGNQRQLSQATERHVERARDRGGRQRQHMHLGAHRLEALLVAHPEAVLLIHDDQAEVLKAHVGMQQTMGGDDDVDAAPLKALDHRGRLLARAEA